MIANICVYETMGDAPIQGWELTYEFGSTYEVYRSESLGVLATKEEAVKAAHYAWENIKAEDKPYSKLEIIPYRIKEVYSYEAWVEQNRGKHEI